MHDDEWGGGFRSEEAQDILYVIFFIIDFFSRNFVDLAKSSDLSRHALFSRTITNEDD